MNKLNYLLVLFIIFFIVSSIFIKPQSFSTYFDLGIDATIRSTAYIYNDKEDIDTLKSALISSVEMLR